MGGSYSTNVVDQAVSSMVQSTVSNTNDCKSTKSADQVASIAQNCSKTNVANIHNTNFKTVDEVDVKCFQTAVTSQEVTNSVQQQAKQLADSVTGQFAMTASESNNIYKLADNLSTAILTSAKQSATAALQTNQSISINQTTGEACDANISYINLDSLGKSVVTSVQNTNSVVSAKNALKTAIDQVSKSKITSWLVVIIVIILILGCGGYAYYYYYTNHRGTTEKKQSDPK